MTVVVEEMEVTEPDRPRPADAAAATTAPPAGRAVAAVVRELRTRSERDARLRAY